MKSNKLFIHKTALIQIWLKVTLTTTTSSHLHGSTMYQTFFKVLYNDQLLLIVTTTLHLKNYYSSHFIHKEAEKEKLHNLPKVNNQ